MSDAEEIVSVLAKRLPAASLGVRRALAAAYLEGVASHAVQRTVGRGSVPTGLSGERTEIIAHVCRALGRLLTDDEIAALLRVTLSTAKSLQRNMLAVFDDLPDLTLRTAFDGASRDGRATIGDIQDGYRVKFSRAENLDIAQVELERLSVPHEVLERTGTRQVMLISSTFQLDEYLPA